MLNKLRPQIFLALLILGGAILFGLLTDYNEVVTAAIAGVIALGKDMLDDERDR